MAIVKELKVDKINSKAKLELIENLEEIIQRVKNNEIEVFAATTLDTSGNIAAYQGRLRSANMLEVLGLVDMLSDYFKGQAHEEDYE